MLTRYNAVLSVMFNPQVEPGTASTSSRWHFTFSPVCICSV